MWAWTVVQLAARVLACDTAVNHQHACLRVLCSLEGELMCLDCQTLSATMFGDAGCRKLSEAVGMWACVLDTTFVSCFISMLGCACV